MLDEHLGYVADRKRLERFRAAIAALNCSRRFRSAT